MKITIKATNLDLTPAIKEYVDEKVGTLAKFVKRYEAEGGELTAVVEIARTTHHHHKGDVFMGEINLSLPGVLLRAVDEDSDVRVAINKARNKMKSELNKQKGGWRRFAPRKEHFEKITHVFKKPFRRFKDNQEL